MQEKKSVAIKLQHSFNQDMGDISTLSDLLDQERSALEKRDQGLIQQTGKNIALLTQTLQKRDSERRRLLGINKINDPTPEDWINLLENTEKQSGLPLIGFWRDLEKQLKHCNTKLQINQKIVSQLQNSVNTFLNSLSQNQDQADTYSALGKKVKPARRLTSTKT